MYKSDNFKQLDNETFTLKINTDRACIKGSEQNY